MRIGLAVVNTLADGLGVPIVGETGGDWQSKALERLQRGENDRVVLPLYGGEAHVTQPRK
jgi:tRNA A37 threonylcarbamoyladenosine modification protein TsaB